MRTLALFLMATTLAWGQDWPVYGHDLGNRKYSTLTQINTGNVSQLTQAWVFDTNTTQIAGVSRATQSTPLVVNGVMYMVTGHQSLVAIDPATGKQLWVYIHKHVGRGDRGVAYWPGDRRDPPEILFGTYDGFLVAIEAKTGKPAVGFGNQGEIDLKVGMKDKFPDAHYGLSSAPLVYKNLVITGSHTQDSPGLGGKGDVRARDVRTGKLAWTFHAVPQPGEKGHDTWLDDGWKDRSGVNAWTFLSVDPQSGMLFIPFDSPSYDFYGGDRHGANLYGNALVAVDASTGKLKWYFQTIHHDIWDYDSPGPPTLVDVVRDGKRIPAVVQSTKTGLVYIFDRRDGKPIYGVEERPVPRGDVPEEWYSPTQPFPLKPPPLTRQSFKRDEIAKLTPEHQKFCEDLFDANGGAHNDGPFTPVGMKPTVVFPTSNGGANWGGGSVDPNLGYFFLNTRSEGFIGRMVKTTGHEKKDGLGQNISQNAYIRQGRTFSQSGTGWPCAQPPWSEFAAINLNTGDLAWRIPFGRVDELEAKGIMNTGSVTNIGGSVATAGGVLFIGATTDARFHAYESKTGKLLWETKLMAQAQANPITYMGKDGKQYVAVAAGDSLVAFRLP